MIQITRIEQRGDKGWEWTAIIDNDGIERRYRTDGDGEGLWSWSEVSASWKQGQGHMQFHLPATEAGARRAIEAHWAKRDAMYGSEG